jgi:hypothetical protein
LSSADEILLGGQLIEPNGNITNIDQFKVSDDFDKGETVYFDYEICSVFAKAGDVPPFLEGFCPHGGPNDVYRGRKLASSKLDKLGTWGLVLIMGEQDNGGGFGDIVQKVYKALKSEIDDAIEAGIGALVGGVFGPLGSAIGAALAWAVGKLIEWLVSLFDNPDDLVAAKTWQLRLEHRTQSYIEGLSTDELPAPKGTWASPMKKLAFKGDGGSYEVRAHWRAFT